MEGGWNEEDSRAFLGAAAVVTPSRGEVFDLFAVLAPAGRDDRFTAIELCCGGGDLGDRLLRAFPAMRYLGLDGSAVMLAAAARRLQAHGDRVTLRPFRLEAQDWRQGQPDDVRLIVTSLAIHHLDGQRKRELYRDLRAILAPGGALLVFDLVLPAGSRARAAAADAWDLVVRGQSATLTGSDEAYEAFVAERANIYRHPDPADMPDSLFAQLRWLSAAGFVEVDAFWLRAGHALFGGFVPLGRATREGKAARERGPGA